MEFAEGGYWELSAFNALQSPARHHCHLPQGSAFPYACCWALGTTSRAGHPPWGAGTHHEGLAPTVWGWHPLCTVTCPQVQAGTRTRTRAQSYTHPIHAQPHIPPHLPQRLPGPPDLSPHRTPEHWGGLGLSSPRLQLGKGRPPLAPVRRWSRTGCRASQQQTVTGVIRAQRKLFS